MVVTDIARAKVLWAALGDEDHFFLYGDPNSPEDWEELLNECHKAVKLAIKKGEWWDRVRWT